MVAAVVVGLTEVAAAAKPQEIRDAGEDDMELGQLLNENISKKLGVAITAMIVLAYVGADPSYIAAVAIVELLVQGYLDRKK